MLGDPNSVRALCNLGVVADASNGSTQRWRQKGEAFTITLDYMRDYLKEKKQKVHIMTNEYVYLKTLSFK